jgi:hypothetical protein
MFYLSGAINVLLFLIIRPGLLLFPRPKELDDPEQEVQLTAQGTGAVVSSHTTQFQHSPEPIRTSAALENGGPRDTATPSRVNSTSRRISDDI